MVIIPRGQFRMGASKTDPDASTEEEPNHLVEVGYRFAVGRFPVTFDEYDRFRAASGLALPQDEGWGRGRRPVINVGWNEARAYAVWLSQQTGAPYRLLSEAEWEYACRASTQTLFAFGDRLSIDDANFCSNIGSTTVVGRFKANNWGLCDMHGNVKEWVEDSWHDGYSGAPRDGSPWVEAGSSPCRVVRGGAWNNFSWVLRSSWRGRASVDVRSRSIGFRVARDL